MKEGHESFREYAQRWRDLVAQVAPPTMEREMIIVMVDTLPVFYYEKMVGYTPSSFADLVFANERIKEGLKARDCFRMTCLSNNIYCLANTNRQ